MVHHCAWPMTRQCHGFVLLRSRLYRLCRRNSWHAYQEDYTEDYTCFCWCFWDKSFPPLELVVFSFWQMMVVFPCCCPNKALWPSLATHAQTGTDLCLLVAHTGRERTSSDFTSLVSLTATPPHLYCLLLLESPGVKKGKTVNVQISQVLVHLGWQNSI